MSTKNNNDKLKDLFSNGLKTNDPFFLIKFIKKNGLSNSDTAEHIIKFLYQNFGLNDYALYVLILTSIICNNEFVYELINNGFRIIRICKKTIHNSIDSTYKDSASSVSASSDSVSSDSALLESESENNKRKRDDDNANNANKKIKDEGEHLEITNKTIYTVDFNPFFEYNGVTLFKFLIDNKEFSLLNKILNKLVKIDNLLSLLTENNDEVLRIYGIKFKRKDIIHIFEAAFHTNNDRIISKILKDPLSINIDNEILDGIQLCYNYFDIYDVSYYQEDEPVDYENKIDFVALILKLRMNILFFICYNSQVSWDFGLDEFIQSLEIPLIVSEKLPEFLLKYDEGYYDNVDEAEDFNPYE